MPSTFCVRLLTVSVTASTLVATFAIDGWTFAAVLRSLSAKSINAMNIAIPAKWKII
ncbi:MAG: hypothetical protein WAO58_10740 [Fimbriimonadaceae bacterium]